MASPALRAFAYLEDAFLRDLDDFIPRIVRDAEIELLQKQAKKEDRPALMVELCPLTTLPTHFPGTSIKPMAHKPRRPSIGQVRHLEPDAGLRLSSTSIAAVTLDSRYIRRYRAF